MGFKETRTINGIHYDVEIRDGRLFFSEYEDNPYGKNNGTDCDLKEFVAGSSPDALRVRDLIRSLRGESELERIIGIGCSLV